MKREIQLLANADDQNASSSTDYIARNDFALARDIVSFRYKVQKLKDIIEAGNITSSRHVKHLIKAIEVLNKMQGDETVAQHPQLSTDANGENSVKKLGEIHISYQREA